MAFVSDRIDKYFDINTNETTASVRWKAFRAYLRRQMICMTSSITNNVNLKLKRLEDKIKNLEKEMGRDKTNAERHQQELLLLRAQYNELSFSKAENSSIRLK